MRGGDGSCDAIFRMYKKLEGVPPDEQAAAAAATAAGSDGAHTPPPLPEPPAASSANSADYANPTNAAAADTAPGNPGKRPRIFGPEDATEAACHSPSSNASYGSDGRSSSLGGEGGASEGGPKRQAMRGVAPSAGRRGGENRAQHCGRANCYRCNERKYISCGADRKGAGSSPENDGLEVRAAAALSIRSRVHAYPLTHFCPHTPYTSSAPSATSSRTSSMGCSASIPSTAST